MRNKRNATIAAIVGTIVLVVGLWLIVRNIGNPVGHPLNTLAPRGRQSQDIQNLVIPVFIVAGLVFLAVEVGIIWMVARFRRNKDDVDGEGEPVQRHGNTPLEIGWTIVPALVLAVLAVFNVQTILKLDDSSKDAVQVSVIGQQWWWEFRYDTNKDGTPDIITATQMVIPVGRDVDVTIQSNDVIHSFWIPALNGKKDAVPGRTHSLVFTAEKAGIYEGQCTEYCGLSHGVMRMQVKALKPADYQKWLKRMTKPPEQPTKALAKAGQALFVGQCARCHQINGLNPQSTEPYTYKTLPDPQYGKDVKTSLSAQNAPNLTHLMMRQTFAGGLLPLYEGAAARAVVPVPEGTPDTNNLKRWLRNPEDIKPMDPENNQGMPNLNLSEQQIDQLVAYLVTLK
jgi:cytochrome c oxidase subunit II